MFPGAYGCDTCVILPIGEHAHGPYTVSVSLTTVPAVCPVPDCTLIARPNPSSVVNWLIYCAQPIHNSRKPVVALPGASGWLFERISKRWSLFLYEAPT